MGSKAESPAGFRPCSGRGEQVLPSGVPVNRALPMLAAGDGRGDRWEVGNRPGAAVMKRLLARWAEEAEGPCALRVPSAALWPLGSWSWLSP